MSKKKKKIGKNWFNDMVLGCFNPHFNLGAIVEKKLGGIFCVFVTVFFSVSKSGNLNNWHFPAKIEGPQRA